MDAYVKLSEDCLLYIDTINDEKVGILRNIKNRSKIYVNQDALLILLEILKGRKLDEIIPGNLPLAMRASIEQKIADLMSVLLEKKFLFVSDRVHGFSPKTVSTNPPLRVIFIETTKRCNLKCRHCYVTDCANPRPDLPEFSAEDIIGIIREADRLGVMEIQLTGGEFFTLPNAVDILSAIRSSGMACSVFTNGTIGTEKFFSYIAHFPYNITFYVSIDGPEEIHDRFRRSEGCYKKTIDFINRLKSIKCDVRVTTIIGQHNIAQIDWLSNLVQNELGIQHRFDAIQKVGRGINCQDLIVSADEFASSLGKFREEIRFLDSHDNEDQEDWLIPSCGVGSGMLFVDAYGNISLCPTLTKEQHCSFLGGNIRNSSISEIWEKSTAFSIYRGIQCRRIEKCGYREKCNGGCRSRAFLLTGDIHSPDPYLCKLYGLA